MLRQSISFEKLCTVHTRFHLIWVDFFRASFEGFFGGTAFFMGNQRTREKSRLSRQGLYVLPQLSQGTKASLLYFSKA
jgi:hypothetical protein